MGKDKYENEDLIKWAIKEDYWFHVDDLSSAHVYLKPPLGPDDQPLWSLDSIPEDLVLDCAQLVKANSIEGCKMNGVRVVYTPASNLRKEQGFAVGQVAFHNNKLLRYTRVEKKNNDVLNRLSRTKQEKVVDFEAEHARRLQHEKLKRKAAAEMTRIKEIEERQRQEEEENLRSYASVFSKLENNFNNEAGNKNSDHIKENRRQLEEDFF